MMTVEPKRREMDIAIGIVRGGETTIELPKDIGIDAESPRRVLVKKTTGRCPSQITFQISVTDQAESGVNVYPDIVWLTEENGYSDYFKVLSNTDWTIYKEE